MRRSKTIALALTAGLVLISLSQCRKDKLSEAELEEYKEQGKYIVDTTFKVLSTHLQQAVKDSGIAYAVRYCNVNAYPLTDSLSREFNAEISRRTTRTRNPENAANARDKVYLISYAKLVQRGETPKPSIAQHRDRITYYHPILLKPFCETCHGSKEMIGPAYETIASLYPHDEAYGYTAGDLRGLWRIDFER